MKAQKLTRIAAILSLGLFTLQASALAQNGCKQVKAQLVETSTNSGATATGTITNGGELNGTTLAVFNLNCAGCINGALFTPDPTTVSFTSDFTITTNHGELKASNVYLFNFAGVGAFLSRINPITSTGRFAGATGVLYSAAKATSFTPFTVQEEITGEICFAK